MGFLKRLFSLSSSRRGKKKRIPLECDPVEYALPYSETRAGRQNNEHEASASRLLRSSSAHFAVVNEVDYSNLPPLPHPINTLLGTPGPASAAPSIRSASTAPSYTVTIISRETIARTEFPNANPPIPNDAITTPKRDTKITPRRRTDFRKVPVTPRDQDRLLRLRQDPSVASLLNMYDEEGRIGSHAFSNTPPEVREYLAQGRDQVRRTGSTLRQLLGSPANANGESEGDISWAERFLGEENGSTTSLNSDSSFGFETPKDFACYSDEKLDQPTLPNDHDLSMTMNASDLCPTISSLEVELSGATDSTSITESACKDLDIMKTPRPASEMFSFLTQKRRRPQGPLSHSPPSLSSHSPAQSTDSLSISKTNSVAIPITDDTQPRIFPKQSVQNLEPIAFPTAFDTPALKTVIKKEPSKSMQNLPQPESPTVRKTGKTSVPNQLPASRIPRGPRPSASTRSKSMPKPGHEETGSLSMTASSSKMDLYTAVPERTTHRRGGSQARKYALPLNDTAEELRPPKMASTSRMLPRPRVHTSRSIAALPVTLEKENSPPPATPPKDLRYKSGGLNSLPVTPIRHNSLLRVAHGVQLPSPASSSELSPLARQMMTTVREKRMAAREKEREKSRSRSRLRV
ncbi:hypothetical protein NEOLEDRAFT_1176493 [Neolentinus lepideus HHB14362 ss-1]|uniref:Uncharacterized protein n=1 Tax=Neolentinus lepideus HHB14362 ss-1 TaxID=1314782 RepID=A0A165UBL3_9AGAM|nr:hypothetical protein NEOLEDRAFT_1176493 [Neolentinus lepideus HHB14362 ss-1]